MPGSPKNDQPEAPLLYHAEGSEPGSKATGPNSILLMWSDLSDNEDGFEIDRWNGETWITVSHEVPANVWEFTVSNGLTPLTEYTFRLRAYNEFGFSSYSSIVITTTPSAPGDFTLTATPATWYSVDLTWTDAGSGLNAEENYKVYKKEGDGSWEYVTQVAANDLNHTVENLRGLRTYSFKVIAVNTGGEKQSNIATATTLTPPPPVAPSNLTAVATYYDEVELKWTDNSEDETGFVIEGKLSSGSTWQPVAEVGENVTKTTVTQIGGAVLQGETTYEFRVMAKNEGGNSAPVSAVCTTLAEPPAGVGTYLESLFIERDCLIGYETASATVSLNKRATSSTVVGLTCTSEACSLPSAVTVPAGQRHATFQITVSASESTEAFVRAEVGAWVQQARITYFPTLPAEFSGELVTIAGNGGVWITFDVPKPLPFGNRFKGYDLYRSSNGAPLQKISTTPLTVGQYVDNSVPALGMHTYSLQITDTIDNSAFSGQAALCNVESLLHSLNISGVPPTYMAPFEVALVGINQEETSYTVYTDGEPAASLVSGAGLQMGAPRAIADPRTAFGQTHAVFVASNFDESGTLQSSNSASTVFGGTLFSPFSHLPMSIEEDVYPSISADLLEPAPFCVTIKTPEGSVVRSWSGFGRRATITWNGQNANGTSAPNGVYIIDVRNTNTDVQKAQRVTKYGIAPELLLINNEIGGIQGLPQSDWTLPDTYQIEASRQLSSAMQSAANQLHASKGISAVVLKVHEKEHLDLTWVPILKRWLSGPVLYFGIMGHGWQNAPNHYVKIAGNVSLRNDHIKGVQSINVPDIVIQSKHFRYVYLDTCNSLGCNPDSPPTPEDPWRSSMTIFSRPQDLTYVKWCDAFNISLIESDSAFVANNGWMYFGSTYPNCLGSAWHNYRMAYWNYFGQGYSAQEAILVAKLGIPSIASEPNPRTTWYFQGQGFPKTTTIGDFVWP